MKSRLAPSLFCAFAGLLPPIAEAQTFRLQLRPNIRAAGIALQVPLTRRLSQTSLVASLPPALGSSLPTPMVPAPVLAPRIAPVAAISAAIAPEIVALQNPQLGADAAKASGERILDRLLRTESMVTASQGEQPPIVRVPRRKSAVSSVSFDAGIGIREQEIFFESLRRRKAGWFRGLSQAGVSLLGPVEPVLVVRSAQGLSPAAAAYADFVVDWSQGETRMGSFRARIRLKDMSPFLSRLAVPPAPIERRLFIRFQKKSMPESEISQFLESRRLRLLSRHWEGVYTVAVTGADQADAVARELSGVGDVLYATPEQFQPPERDRLFLVFKKETSETAAAGFLRENGLRVLSAKDGVWTVAALSGDSAAETAARLSTEGILFYSLPEKIDIPEERQFVLRLRKESSDDEAAALFAAQGLQVLRDYGGGSYKVAGPADRQAITLAQELSASGAAVSAVAVGSLTEEQVRSAARSAVSHKGQPWSSTEYNAASYYTRLSLEMEGATQAQLKLYDELCAAAPVRGGSFNPWAGD